MAKKKRNMQRAPKGDPVASDKADADEMVADLRKMLNEQRIKPPETIGGLIRGILKASRVPFFGSAPQTPLEEAEQLMKQAWEAPQLKDALRLAHKALELSPDCVDAHILLAQHAKSLKEARERFEQGVAAGERVLGRNFKKYKGSFWGILETRPYMHARLGLADVLLRLGEREAAASHMAEMLELNPEDNQGVRDRYIPLLLELNDHSRLEQMLTQYSHDWSPSVQYSAVLFEFRLRGASSTAGELLRRAMESNPHVPAFLLRRKPMPKKMPPFYSPGDQFEAMDYVLNGARGWVETKGALDWLRKATAK